MFRWVFRVDYSDTDAMGVAHHASYFRWLERARIEWLRSMAMPYGELEKEGYGLPLRAAQIEYKRPLRFDDEAEISVWTEEIGRAGLKLGYRVRLGEAEVATAITDHVLCKRGEKDGQVTWTATRIPDEWRNLWLRQSAAKSSTSP